MGEGNKEKGEIAAVASPFAKASPFAEVSGDESGDKA